MVHEGEMFTPWKILNIETARRTSHSTLLAGPKAPFTLGTSISVDIICCYCPSQTEQNRNPGHYSTSQEVTIQKNRK